MATVLICDDDELVRRAISRALVRAGYQVHAVSDGDGALAWMKERPGRIDVLVTDLRMPGLDGRGLLRALALVEPEAVGLLISGAADYQDACSAVNEGHAFRLLSKPFEVPALVDAVERAAELRRIRRERHTFTEKLAAHNGHLRRLNEVLLSEVAGRTQASLEGLIAALDLRDTETQWHSRRVSLYARRLGVELGLDGDALLDAMQGALLHDLGKIGVRDAVLLKPGPLDPEEWEEMRRHPALGHQILSTVPHLRGAAEVVYTHHERWDGTGYPRGLGGEKIPVGARIFAVVDTYDAITSDRPYRKGRDHQAARDEIVRCSGTQFDPRVVRAFCAVDAGEWLALKDEVERWRRRALEALSGAA